MGKVHFLNQSDEEIGQDNVIFYIYCCNGIIIKNLLICYRCSFRGAKSNVAG